MTCAENLKICRTCGNEKLEVYDMNTDKTRLVCPNCDLSVCFL